jgi:DNA-binding response OmpR family regulator
MALAGHTILVVEDEPLIALAIGEDFKAAGATVHTAYNLSEGLRLADHPDLSVAVVDFGLSDGKGSALCERLNERQVPFILHTGYTHVHEACQSRILVPKPAAPGQLVSVVESLLQADQMPRAASPPATRTVEAE